MILLNSNIMAIDIVSIHYDLSSDYKAWLVALQMLPLMMQLELYCIMFLFNALRSLPTSSIFQPISLSVLTPHVPLPLSNSNILCAERILCNISISTECLRFGTLYPALNINQSISSIKRSIHQFLWDHFMQHFNSDNVCTYHFLCPCSKYLHFIKVFLSSCILFNYNFRC